MSSFGKPPQGANPGSGQPAKPLASGKIQTAPQAPAQNASAQRGPHGGSHTNAVPPKKDGGKKHEKVNSGEGGKAYGSPTAMGGTSGTGFDPGSDNFGGDRWSYGSSQGSGDEWGASGHEQPASVWHREGSDEHEKGSGW